jgi:hypothetical protein
MPAAVFSDVDLRSSNPFTHDDEVIFDRECTRNAVSHNIHRVSIRATVDITLKRDAAPIDDQSNRRIYFLKITRQAAGIRQADRQLTSDLIVKRRWRQIANIIYDIIDTWYTLNNLFRFLPRTE